jgi:hypothetical protein
MMLAFEYMTVSHNYTTVWNGMGAIDAVIKKEAKGVQRHRVLVPWLVWATEWCLGGEGDPPERLPIYLFWKWALMSAAMMVAGWFFSPIIALGMALYWACTFQYDYWSVYAEALSFLLVITGNVWLACLGAVLGATSKPTAVILPLVYATQGGGWQSLWVALAFAVPFGAIQWWQGPSPETKWRKPMNVAPHHIFRDRPDMVLWYLMGLGVIVASLVAFVLSGSMLEPFRSTAWVLPVICGAAFFNANVYEPRVFALNSIWIVSLLL